MEKASFMPHPWVVNKCRTNAARHLTILKLVELVSMHCTLFTADINECSSYTTNNCSSLATCTNIGGGYICQCFSGLTGDGVNCVGKATVGCGSFSLGL